MRLPLSFLIAIVHVALVGLVRAQGESGRKTVIPDRKDPYKEKNYSSLNFEQQAAIIFRPLLNIENGCDASAAVFGMDGDNVLISGGIAGGSDSGGCRRDKQDQRMYAKYQYTKDKKKLVLVYAIYFPKISRWILPANHDGGAAHLWQCIALVMNVNPKSKDPGELTPESIWWSIDQSKMTMKPWKELKQNEIDGKTHVKFKMYHNRLESAMAHLGTTGQEGQTIPLLFPEHFEDKVQKVLSEELWAGHGAPLSDAGFKDIVDKVLDKKK